MRDHVGMMWRLRWIAGPAVPIRAPGSFGRNVRMVRSCHGLRANVTQPESSLVLLNAGLREWGNRFS